jgi:PKD repeat protein
LTGLDVTIQGAGGANNQFYPDGIAAQPEGTPVYQYVGSPLLGGVAYAGTYRTVYFSFGYEAITSASQRQAVMSATLNYLGVCGAPSAPTASFVAAAALSGEPVVFTNTTQGSPWMRYVWDFGDGVTSTLATPQVSHTYAAGGDFTTMLTAVNAYGANTFSAVISVPPVFKVYLPLVLK